MTNRSLPILFGIAGIAWTTAQSISPDMGTSMEARLDAVAASPGLQSTSTALLAVAAIFFVVSAISLARVPLTGRGARLIKTGGVMLGIAGVWLAAGRAGFSLVMLQLTSEGVSRESALIALSADPGIAFLGILPTLPALLFGPVLIGSGIGLRMRSFQSWLPLIAWVIGIGIFIVSEFINKLGEGMGIGVASLGLVLTALAIARFSAELPATTAGAARNAQTAQPA
ncbi:hypothetical protein ACX3O0_01000 [Homoserinimonas sp. A447]